MDTTFLCLRLLQLLPQNRRKSHNQTDCTLNSCPPELIILILSHLPPESTLAFALTCRALFIQYFPRSPQLSAPTKTALLQLIERDYPNLLFCFNCIRLHRWRMKLFSKYGNTPCHMPCTNPRELPTWRYSLMNRAVPDLGYNLTYSLAWLVTNRHLYGPGHGPPLKDLTITEPKRSQRFLYVPTERYCRAKIINNSLYLHGKRVIWSPKPRVIRSAKKNSVLEDWDFRHLLKRYRNNLVWCHINPPELALDRSWLSHNYETSGGINSCPICFTDYQIKVVYTPFTQLTVDPGSKTNQEMQWQLGKSWVVEITRWQKLGECRSPQDLEWRNVTNPYVYSVVLRKDICAAGMVRREWMGGHISPGDNIEGTFVPEEYRILRNGSMGWL